MADKKLSTEQVLLLENLMYLTNDDPLRSVSDFEGMSVGEFINSIDINAVVNDKEYGTFVTGAEWKSMIEAVKNDRELMQVEIMTTHVDYAEGGGGGFSALFANPDTGEAVVAFRGTANMEWKDNFVGGGITNMPDGVSTQQQVNALEWYQSLDLEQYDSITLTGHSKGGNKAKYITIMDGSVDRCVSFDGQGFSDEFVEQYSDLIAQRQRKISNHNAEYDYVNLLLNDIGEMNFYEGQEVGNFLENHCPNILFSFDENGNPHMVPVETRAEEMGVLDDFLNSYLRSVSPEEKQEALAAVGVIAEMAFNGAHINDILHALTAGSYVDELSYLLAYFIRYEQENPEFADAFRHILTTFGMSDLVQIVDIIDGIMNWKYFDTLMDIFSLADDLPDWLLNRLIKFVHDTLGISLTVEEARYLLSVFESTNGYLDEIQAIPDGTDKVTAASDFCSFSIKPDMIREAPESIKMVSKQADS